VRIVLSKAQTTMMPDASVRGTVKSKGILFCGKRLLDRGL